MLLLTLKTDQPIAEIGLFHDNIQLHYIRWEAHRRLAETIHLKLSELLAHNSSKLNDLGAIVVFKGPGSFTGLRIGISVANALAYGAAIPIIGTTGENWIDGGIRQILSGSNDVLVHPHYGAPAHVTKPKK